MKNFRSTLPPAVYRCILCYSKRGKRKRNPEMMNEKDIAKLLEAGGNRWSKYGKDRIYIDATALGLEVEYYKTGNVRNATWQGEGISNADARRLLGSKVYVDCADGSLHVSTDFSVLCNESTQLENVAAKFVEDALAKLREIEAAGIDAGNQGGRR